MNYGDAINWCVQHDAVFRFVQRNERQDFIALNQAIPGDKSLELCQTIAGKNYVAHVPLDSSTEPSKAVARALITAVQHFGERRVVVAGVSGN
jgi:hypothetical protein